jgi:hypothetical protein
MSLFFVSLNVFFVIKSYLMIIMFKYLFII